MADEFVDKVANKDLKERGNTYRLWAVLDIQQVQMLRFVD